MGFDNQTSNSNATSPCIYMTAPTSPEEYSRSSSMYYYSAPASPRLKASYATAKTSGDNLGSNLDDFEFETSKRFSGQLHSETTDSPVCEGVQYRDRWDSLPAMAFADELFLNGLVMPLKLPPRLQSESEFNCFSQKSTVSSPRTACKFPFARKSSWNDDFDPFMVALEKVREEKRGRNSHHRRSRSYSPFRAASKWSTGSTDCCNQDSPKGNGPMEPPPSYSGPLDFKGSAYARWVRDQTSHGLSPKSPTGFLSRQRVRPLKTEQDGSVKPVSPKENYVGESKVKKLKVFLLRYASFGRRNSGSKKTKTRSESRKSSYFGGSSFKFKGNVQSNGKKKKKKIPDETNMAVVQYKPSIAFCLGYGVGSRMKVI